MMQATETGSSGSSVTEAEFAALVRNAKIQSDPLPVHAESSDHRPGNANDSLPAIRMKFVRIAWDGKRVANPKEKVTEAVCEGCRSIFPMKKMWLFNEGWFSATCQSAYLEMIVARAKSQNG